MTATAFSYGGSGALTERRVQFLHIVKKNRHVGNAIGRRCATKAAGGRAMGNGADALDRPVLVQTVEHGSAKGIAGTDRADDIAGIDGP